MPPEHQSIPAQPLSKSWDVTTALVGAPEPPRNPRLRFLVVFQTGWWENHPISSLDLAFPQPSLERNCSLVASPIHSGPLTHRKSCGLPSTCPDVTSPPSARALILLATTSQAEVNHCINLHVLPCLPCRPPASSRLLPVVMLPASGLY